MSSVDDIFNKQFVMIDNEKEKLSDMYQTIHYRECSGV